MTKSGRHAAKPTLAARLKERSYQFRATGHHPAAATFRRKVLTVASAATLIAGSGAFAATQTGLFTTEEPAAAPSSAAVVEGRDAIAASRDLERLSLDAIERVDITVTADGETATHNVPALSLAEALADAGIVVGMFDTVNIPLSQTAAEGMDVVITRGNSGMASDEDVTEFETIEKQDPNLFKGETKVESEGQNGITRTTYRVELNEGEETGRTALATVVVQEKQDRVVLVGTKEKPKPQPVVAAAPRDSGSTTSRQPAPAAPPAAPVPAGSAQDIARGMLGSYGWGGDQMSCLSTLWHRESGWNHLARNPSSGAYGIPQALPGHKMATAGADWRTNPATQIRWGLTYIQGRYGSPCAALNHSYARGWY